MAELTKTKVLDIQTGSATKNVENLTKSFVPLRQQIKDLTLQLQQLEQGTEEYNRVATRLAETRQKQVEITEAAKYANRDFGQTMSNLTNISLGLVGGINAVNASINLLGGDADKMQKALAPIQMAMAVIQGFAALDTAIKSLKGLSNAFNYTGESAQKAADEIGTMESELEGMGDKTVSLDVDTKKAETSVKKLDKDITKTAKNKKIKIEADTKKADTAVKKLQTEIGSVEGTTVKVDADTTEAETKVGTLITEIESIPSKDITIDADTTPVTESLEQVTETIEDMADVDIEFKADGIGEVTDEVKSLGEAEKTLTTNTSNATKATQNLDTATKAAAGSTATMAKGTKQAAVGTATLAAGEGVATKATWTLTGALKAVGTAIKSIPVIGWIAMGITLLTSLIKLIGKANKESKEGVDIAVKSLEAERNRKEVAAEIAAKYREMRIELSWALAKLALLPKSGREYKETMEDVTKTLGLSSDYVEKFGNRAKDAKDYFVAMGEAQENLNNNLKEQEETEKKINGFLSEVNDVFVDNYNVSEKVLDNLVEEGKIREGQRKELAKLRKDLLHGKTDEEGFNESVKVILQEQLGEYEKQKKTLEGQQAALEEIVTENKNNLYAIQDESDAYDEQLKKQKEANDAYKEFLRKREDSQKSYIQTLEDMKIADAEYEGDWNRYADERKKKEERIYNDDLKSYKKQLKEKLITQEQYDNLIKQREEQYNNDIAQIALDTNKKIWDEQLTTALEEIEKEKQARKKAYEEEYVVNVKTNVSGADDTRNIQNEQAELDAILKTNEVLKERLTIVQQNSDESKEYADYLKQLQDQIAENEQKAQELQLQIDLDSYNKRKKIVDEYYDRLYEKVEQAALDIEARNNVWGLGSPAVNTALQQQQLLIETLEQERETLENDHEQKLISEEEYLIRKAELEKRYSDESTKLTRLELETKVNYFNAAFAAMQQLSNAVGAILDEEMSHYDENTQEYRQLAISRAVLDTIMGSFSAFISGVQSGIPAPANFILGGVLAALTTALGIASIAKLKSGNTSGTGSGTVSSAVSAMEQTTYETTAYEQQAELMGNVADQRVYVVENDISTTQNRVAVRESNATY